MSGIATVTSKFTIENQAENLQVRTYPEQFRATVDGTKGPTPGALDATVFGTLVDFSQLTTPGLCRIINRDTSNYVEVGTYDGLEFYPLMELLPGEFYVFRLSRNFSESYSGTSLGTDPAGTVSLMIKANTATCVVSVEAYER